VPSPSRIVFPVLIVAALLIRLANTLWLALSGFDMLDADAVVYWSAAGQFLEHGAFLDGSLSALPLTERMPGYILFLAALRFIFGAEFWPVLLAQAVIDTASVVVSGLIVRRFGRACMLTAMALAGLSINQISQAGMILTDSLFLFCLLLSLWGAERATATGGWRWILLAGFAIGMATLVRPASLPLIACMAAGAGLTIFLRNRSWLQSTSAAFMMLCASIAVILPWQIRNHALFDSWSLTTQSGTHLQNWVVAEIKATADGTTRAEAAAQLQQQSAAEMALIAADNPFQLSAAQVAMAKRQLSEQPLGAIVQTYLRGAALFLAAPSILFDPRVRALPKPSFDGTTGPLPQRVGRMLSQSDPRYVALAGIGTLVHLGYMALAGWGLIILCRRHPWAGMTAILWVLYFLLLTGPVSGAKYRLPAEAVLTPCAAIALQWLWLRANQRLIALFSKNQR